MSEITAEQIKDALTYLQNAIHKTAVDKGWWNDHDLLKQAVALFNENRTESGKPSLPDNISDVLFRTSKSMLAVTEISEGVESLRKGDPPDDKLPQFSGQTVEIADDIIRQLDLAARFSLPVIDAIIAKMKFNNTREHMHGGKAI